MAKKSVLGKISGYQHFIIYFYVAVVILVEGLGISFLAGVSWHLLLISAVPLLTILILKAGKLHVKKELLIWNSTFAIIILLSLLFSVNQLQSIKYIAIYLVYILIYLCSFHFAKSLTGTLEKFILIIGIFLCIYSFILVRFSDYTLYLMPESGYQLVFSYISSHNHLGDFLILTVIICLHRLLKKPNILDSGLLIFFGIFLFFSYSRSAYLALSLTALIMVITKFNRFLKQKSILFMVFGLIIGTLIFSLTVVKEFSYFPILGDVQNILKEKFNLKNKNLLASRPEYIRQAIKASFEKPVLGWGSGNYVYASIKYTNDKNRWTFSSHNFFLDILVENGILVLLLMIFAIFTSLRKSNKDLYYFLFLAMLINFQTDYTFRLNSMLVLFFILMGYNQSQTNKHDRNIS